MSSLFSRTELLFGRDAMEKLAASRVAVFGVGGVGGYAAEALARSGIGAIDLIDSDRVCESNINRQLHATCRTIGRYKVDVAAERIAEINPLAKVRVHRIFYLPETADSFCFSDYDYIIDAVDTVTAKIALVMNAEAAKTPIISSMGAGNKLDPTAFEVADIYSTSVCPLAKVMRRELKRRGIKSLKVVYSREIPLVPGEALPAPDETDPPLDASADSTQQDAHCPSGLSPEKNPGRRRVPGSCSFVPPVAGLIMAGEVIKDLA